jgi:holo-ACP synthase
MNIDAEVIKDILLARELRAQKQRALIEKYKASLISFTLNIPGPCKDRQLYRKIHQEGMGCIIESLCKADHPIVYKSVEYKHTGVEGYICTQGTSGEAIKKITVMIEETHDLGRLFDMDVMDGKFYPISRKSLGFSERKCLICSDNPLICRKKQKHTLEDLIKEIEKIAQKYFENKEKFT